MGRARKQTAEYFPHFAGESRTKFVLESSWGNDGYAFWFKLLELLCQSDGHYYDCSRPADKMYLTAYAKVTEETADAILDVLAVRENIDPELWREHKIIWCQALVDNLAGMYAKRTTPMPQKPSLGGADAPPEGPEPVDKAETGADADGAPGAAEKSTGKGKRGGGKKKAQPDKTRYAEFVYMTTAEYEKLVSKYGEADTRRLIEKLDNAKGSKGYEYKSDYRAILSWVVGEVLGHGEAHGQKGGGGGGENRGNPPGGFKPSGGFRQG